MRFSCGYCYKKFSTVACCVSQQVTEPKSPAVTLNFLKIALLIKILKLWVLLKAPFIIKLRFCFIFWREYARKKDLNYYVHYKRDMNEWWGTAREEEEAEMNKMDQIVHTRNVFTLTYCLNSDIISSHLQKKCLLKC